MANSTLKGWGPKSRAWGAGFTLLELLVATTILSLMLLFLFSVFDQSTKAWQAGERKIDAFREARAALFMIRRDLRGVMVGEDTPMVYNRLGVDIGFSGALAPETSASNLFFLTRLPLNAQGSGHASEVCAAGYYVAWMRSAVGSDEAANFSYNLIRYFVPSGTPGNSVGTVPHLLSFMAGGSSLSEVATLFPRAAANVVPENEVLSRNIIRFSLVPVVENGSGLVSADPGVLTEVPRMVEITLEVINQATAAQLGDTPAAWTTSSPASKRLIEENAQTFRTRVALNR